MVSPGGAPADKTGADSLEARGPVGRTGIFVKRVYDPPAADDGERLLVDRLWPRGLSKERAQLAGWRRDLAPSDALRRWFGHDPARWAVFRERYRAELAAAGKGEDLRVLAERGRTERITLLFAAADPNHNNAVALKQFLDEIGAGE